MTRGTGVAGDAAVLRPELSYFTGMPRWSTNLGMPRASVASKLEAPFPGRIPGKMWSSLMRRPLGVTIAATILGLMTGFGFLSGLFALIGALFIRNPAIPADASRTVQLVMVGSDLAFFCLLAFYAWVVVDLFRMRRWARYGILVVGALMALSFGAMSALMFLMPRSVPVQANASGSPMPQNLDALLTVVGVIYAAIALIGVWWVIYFNLKQVRQAFAAPRLLADGTRIEDASTTPSGFNPWQGVVIAFAVVSLVGGVSCLVMGIMRLPLFVAGTVLRGNAALITALVTSAVAIFIGVGLLRRISAAFWTAIVWQGLGFANWVTLLSPSVRAHALAYQAEITQRFAFVPGQAQPFLDYRPMLLIGNAVALAIVLLFVYSLWRCRPLFQRAPDAAL